MIKKFNTRIVHISDPHFGTTTTKKISILQKTILQLAPSLVLLSGDITQRARRHQFLQARIFCNSLYPIDVIAVPGNHDLPLMNLPIRFFWPYFGFVHQFQFPICSHKRFGPIDILALNSTSPFRSVQGHIRSSDRQRLSLFSEDALFRIVMFHHPLDCAKSTDEINLLKNREILVPSLETSQVDLVLGGHIHDPLARLSQSRYPNSTRPFPIVLAGTALSSRTRSDAPNSFNLIEVTITAETTELQVTRYDLTSQDTFLPITEMHFQRQGRDLWRVKSTEGLSQL